MFSNLIPIALSQAPLLFHSQLSDIWYSLHRKSFQYRLLLYKDTVTKWSLSKKGIQYSNCISHAKGVLWISFLQWSASAFEKCTCSSKPSHNRLLSPPKLLEVILHLSRHLKQESIFAQLHLWSDLHFNLCLWDASQCCSSFGNSKTCFFIV